MERKRFVTAEKWENVNAENKKVLRDFMTELKQEGRPAELRRMKGEINRGRQNR